MMKNYKLVIFDMDGTTLDTLEDLADAMNYVLKSNDYPLHTLGEIRSYVGNGIRKLVERAVPEGSSEEEIEIAHKQFVEYYPKNCAVKTRPYAGIPELLAALQERGIHTAINSNKDDGAVKILAEQYFGNLLEYSLGTLPDVPKKPAPDGVRRIMEHFHADREETVYVGDSEVDVQTAVNAGVDAVLVDWGFRERSFLEEQVREACKTKAYAGTMKFVSNCGELLAELQQDKNQMTAGRNCCMKHCGTQKLETSRLILRRYTEQDAEAMYKNWASDEQVTTYLTWPAHQSPEVSKRIINEWVNSYAEENYYHWAIVLKENGEEPIGDIAVVGIKEAVSMAHIGYCIGRNWWHQGITSEALQAVIDFLFDTVEVNRVEARHDPRNPNSGQVMKKCGMKYEGTLRSADRNNQGICDACYYGLLREERVGGEQ